MRLRPEQLAQHLGQGLLPIYVVAGEEPLLIEESLDAIRARARQDGYTEREVHEVERGFDWSRLLGSCASLSLFASRKIVELRLPKGPNPGRGRAADESEDDGEDAGAGAAQKVDGARLLAELARRPPQDVLLLLSTGKLDHRQQQAAWYVAMESAGAAVYAAPITLERWPAWVAQRLRAAGVDADQEAVQLLAERTEGNALAAQQDIEKLALLYPQTAVGVEQVRIGVADSARFDAFDLGDRMLGGDAAGAVRTLSRLREEGLDVLAVLGPLTWVLRQWAQAQAQFARHGDVQRACSEARIARARMTAFAAALPRVRATQIYGWLRQANTVDRLAKSTGGKEQAWEELLTWVAAAAGRRIVRPSA